ncbi:hypothetical protein [Coralloluteibacterium stylophorae]|uniref:Lipoprotein n=1 Tax=Coralloluteibacterium stylophorae TaxID=1776034 RepID=A0A8J7VT26_9GAMM|nr:hypothetical protein [Coralloluteibacterium stylophorae]MBS7458800.1 hypothetical protein [Coralloluteibacterium stylophorae]
MASGRAVRLATLLLCGLALGACDREAEREAARQAAAQRAEAAAAQQAAQYETARSERNWGLAKSYGDVLLADYPNTAAAAAVAESLPEVREKAQAERETRRLEGLWSYHLEQVEGGLQRAAVIEAGQPRSPRVRMVLRRHPEWGQSVYLLLDTAEFDCPPGCTVDVAFDGGEAAAFDARKPEENLQALFVEEDARFMEGLAGAKTVTIDTASGGRPLHLVFEVAGVDLARLE